MSACLLVINKNSSIAIVTHENLFLLELVVSIMVTDERNETRQKMTLNKQDMLQTTGLLDFYRSTASSANYISKAQNRNFAYIWLLRASEAIELQHHLRRASVVYRQRV